MRVNAGLIVCAKSPLTLTLSRRERGLIVVSGRIAPRCDTESKSVSEKPSIGPFSLSPGGEGWGEGMDLKHTTKTSSKKKPLKYQGLFNQCG